MASFRLYFLPFTTTSAKVFESANQVDFFNQGSNDVYINGRLLEPGVGFSMLGFPGDFDVTNYEISFAVDNVQGNYLVATVKQYIK